MKQIILIISLCASLAFPSLATAKSVAIDSPNIGSIEIAFSPKGGAQELVLKLIRSAKSDIQMMAYTLTSKSIVNTLIKAKRRGVKVSIAVDSSNASSKAGKSALSALVTAGVHVRTIAKYRILHDKLLIVDGRHVEFGSFNYTQSAEISNSENVTVLWDAPELAEIYFNHWERRWRHGTNFGATY